MEELFTPYTTTYSLYSKIRGELTYYYELSYGEGVAADIIVWLHGSGPRPLDQLNLAGRAYLRAAIKNSHYNRNLRLIMPLCPPDLFWLNGGHGKFRIEDFLIDELIPECINRIGVNPYHNLQVHGYSMGAYGALRLGLKYSGIFRRILSIAAGPLSDTFLDLQKADDGIKERIYRTVFHGSNEVYRRLSPFSIASNKLNVIVGHSLMIELVAGMRDPCFVDNERFANQLKTLGIDITFNPILDVGHRLDLYLQKLDDSLLLVA